MQPQRRRHTIHPFLVALPLVLLGRAVCQQGIQEPHVSECYHCAKCSIDSEAAVTVPLQPWASPSPSPQDIFPTPGAIAAKQLKPNCTSCHGCSAQLQPLQTVTAFGREFKVEPGGSPAWIFTSEAAGGARLVVKVWCLPINKHTGAFSWACDKVQQAVQSNAFLLAQQAAVADCGLLDTTVRVWLAPVNAVEPGTGLHIWWPGLWMERAEGVSLNQLSYITNQRFVQDTVMELLEVKLNRSRVTRAAMMDALTSQCDRHAENVFIDARGQVTLIDNQHALQLHWARCGLDSILLPGTQKNEVVRFGGSLVMKRRGARHKRSINPMLLLDYRCWVPEIGTRYPPQLAACLRSLSSRSPQDIMDAYKFPLLRNAEALHSRARDMLERGFEFALKVGRPTNPGPKRYRWHQPCCKLAVSESAQVTCGHAWNVTAEFPRGDPLHGRAWSGRYPDPGTFEGGSQWTQ